MVNQVPKPCPFCGGPAKTLQYNGTTEATCAKDVTECAGTDALAPVAMWNRRAPPNHRKTNDDQAIFD